MEDLLNNVLIPKLLYNLAVILLIIVMWKLNTQLYKKLTKSVETAPGSESLRYSVLKTVHTAARYAILVMGVLSLMQINGINVTSIITGLGIASAVVGFAVQEPLRDIVSGMHIVTDNFFRSGDCVVYSGQSGQVVSFSIHSTKIRLFDTGRIITVSNRNISEITLIGSTCILDVPLPYQLKTSEAAEYMTEISRRVTEETEADECVYEGIQEFTDSAVIHRLRIECDPLKQLQVLRCARKTVSLVLEEKGTAIPFNQLDVHFDQQDQ